MLKTWSLIDAHNRELLSTFRLYRLLEDRELILRFLSFLVRKPKTYRRTLNIDTWLSDTMIIINALPNLDSREIKKCIKQKTINLDDIEHISINGIMDTFSLAMKRAHKLFGKHAFRKSTDNMRRRPINKSLFEAWGVLLSGMTETQFNLLCTNKKSFMVEYRRLLDDEAFSIAISRDSMKHLSVKLRFEKLTEIINKYSR